jgi:hypothetical protein
MISPIIDKNQLDNVDPENEVHFRQVKAPGGYESNAISFHPKIQ